MVNTKKCDTIGCSNMGVAYSNEAPGTSLWFCNDCLPKEFKVNSEPSDIVALRIQVERFASEMEKKLRHNDYKGGWQGTAPLELLRLLKLEVIELEEALHKSGRHSILKESTNVANFAMFIADNIFHLERRNAGMCGVRHEFQRIQNSHLCEKCKHFEEDNCHTK